MLEGVRIAARKDPVAIGARAGVVPGVKAIARWFDLQNPDFWRRQSIEASGQGRGRIVRHLHAHDLVPRVDAGVGAPGDG